MKRCPQCNRVETDDALVFCRVDRTALVIDPSPIGSEAGMATLGSTSVATEIETSILPHTTESNINRQTAPTTVLPAQAPGTTGALAKPKRRRTALAIAGILTAVVATATAIVVNSYLSRKTHAAIQSIAVLPFVNESGNQDVEYLSDGMTETLISSLSKIPNLSVKARSTVFYYKGKETSPRKIGEESNVQAVLLGRVVQRGDDLKLNLELVNTQTQDVIWSEQYNRKQSELISLQSEVAHDVMNKLKTKLSKSDETRVAKNFTTNPEAYQLYLKGRFCWNKRSDEGLRKSIEYFNQAIEKDPNYALAFAGIADSYAVLFSTALFGFPPKILFEKAKAAALKAIAIDDTLAEAHNALAYALFEYDWDFAGAEKEFRRAIELNPNYATAHHWFGECLSVMGRYGEAISEIKRAQELDPLSLIINSVVGLEYYRARQYDEAIKQLRSTQAMDQNFGPAHEFLFFAYEAKGSFEEAIAERQSVATLYGRESQEVALKRTAALSEGYAKAGGQGYWQKRLEQTLEDARDGYVPPFDIAAIYARLGEKDKAFEWADKAYNERDEGLLHINETTAFDGLRSDPRFVDLVRRVRLPR